MRRRQARGEPGGEARGEARAELPGRRWRYLEVMVHVESWSDSAGRSGRLPEAPVGKAQLATVAPLLDQLGEEGWELVGVASSHSALIFRLFLKRRESAAQETHA